MILRIEEAHMQVAETYARLSKAKRLQVGSIIVKDNRVISIGYNGTPSGWDNKCEEEVDGNLKTKAEVIHAEANAIAKLARSNESGLDSTMYITHSPCFECAKLIHIAGIKKVYFRKHYRNEDGIQFLKKSNIDVEKI
ncbi:hypothetical protein EBU95_15840 [bacterium]|nr:hypothetical protein [bacterium]